MYSKFPPSGKRAYLRGDLTELSWYVSIALSLRIKFNLKHSVNFVIAHNKDSRIG